MSLVHVAWVILSDKSSLGTQESLGGGYVSSSQGHTRKSVGFNSRAREAFLVQLWFSDVLIISCTHSCLSAFLAEQASQEALFLFYWLLYRGCCHWLCHCLYWLSLLIICGLWDALFYNMLCKSRLCKRGCKRCSDWWSHWLVRLAQGLRHHWGILF